MFPVFPLSLDFGATQISRLTKYIFWSKFPKHPSLAPPWALQPDPCAQGLTIQPIRYVPTQEWEDGSTGCSQEDKVHQFQSQSGMIPELGAQTLVSRISHCISLFSARWHQAHFPLHTTPSFPLPHPKSCQVRSSIKYSQHVKNTLLEYEFRQRHC